MCFLFFFFKQNTEYDMRISDWSSTCALPILTGNAPETVVDAQLSYAFPKSSALDGLTLYLQGNNLTDASTRAYWGQEAQTNLLQQFGRVFYAGATRSEEHTSELQSLMRISYAVFCLKKKKREQSRYDTTPRTAVT